MLLAEPLAARVIGLAIEVHRHTGPGVLESVYELCLCRELADAGIAFARQVTIPILYKGAEVGDGFKADIVVAGEPILEIKAVSTILPIHEGSSDQGGRARMGVFLSSERVLLARAATGRDITIPPQRTRTAGCD
jgi:GxxExxY protein